MLFMLLHPSSYSLDERLAPFATPMIVSFIIGGWAADWRILDGEQSAPGTDYGIPGTKVGR
jgi:hypothetical protein